MRPAEAKSLRALVLRFAGRVTDRDDPKAVAYAVQCLRAFLTGCGERPELIENAARLLVDELLGGDRR